MRKCANIGLLVLLPLSCLAADGIQPGTMRMASAPSVERPYATIPPAEARQPSRNLWWASVAFWGASHAADIASSRGHYEANPWLASRDGKCCDARAIGAKTALAVGVPLIQWFAMKRAPGNRLVRLFAAINFGMGGYTFAVAGRNFAMGR